MRVLCVETLRFKEFHSLPDDDYAILSHVWGSNEISYEDIGRATLSEPFLIENKHEASAKLNGCREQARKDGIKYLWIDTCCINQPNHSELSEAINSMFHWYQKSKVCYVYLSDIGVPGDLAASRWFLRGWTLQELIAPQDVKFFNQDWNPIGNKKGLALILSKITRIPQDFLMGRDLEEASIAQRMSWASKRETSKEEDLAYCLFGIFDVHMPLLYGERLRAAFRRLQLEILQHRDDTSMFAWTTAGSSNLDVDNNTFGLLALSPAAFKDSHNIVRADFPGVEGFTKGIRTPILYNNKGLHLSLPVQTQPDRKLVAILDCKKVDEEDKRLAIQLRDISANNGRFARFGDLTTVSVADVDERTYFQDITTEMRLFTRVKFASEEMWRRIQSEGHSY